MTAVKLSVPGRGKRRRGAFTLVELLVVLAIAGVVVALALPALHAAAQRAAAADAVSRLRQVGQGVMLYAADNGQRLPGPMWPGQIPIYDPGREGRLARELAPYLGLPRRDGTYMVDLFLSKRYRAFLRGRAIAEPRVYVLNTRMPIGGTPRNPWGSLTGGPETEPMRLGHVVSSGQGAWAISEADQEHPDVAGAPWKDSTPPGPLHGTRRATWFFDGRVEMLEAVVTAP